MQSASRSSFKVTCVHFPVATSRIINTDSDSLAKALARKAPNVVVSAQTIKKLRSITNTRFGAPLGDIFHKPGAVKQLPMDSDLRLRLDILRNEVAACQKEMPRGSFMRHYLGNVLKEIPA